MNNRGVHDGLVKLANGKAKMYRPDNCVFYRPIGEEYSIVRPRDIESLVRRKIFCGYKEKDVTREECHMCWVSDKEAESMYRQHVERGIIKKT